MVANRAPYLLAVGPAEADGLPFAALETAESVTLFKELGRTAELSSLSHFADSADRSAHLWHLALHGSVLGRTLQGAYLHSAAGDKERRFFASELLARRQSVHTVVLSSCQDGASPALDFVSAARLTGAYQIVAATNRVYDDLAAAFAKRLLAELALSDDLGALRRLQIEALQRGEPEAAWATFSLHGGRP